MNYKLAIVLWSIFTVSIICWDIHRYDDMNPISKCHNAEILIYHDKPMCTECKLYCEVK